jgi:hypothetical protein
LFLLAPLEGWKVVPDYRADIGPGFEVHEMAADRDGREPFLLPQVPFATTLWSHPQRKEVKEHVMAIIGGGGANRFVKEVKKWQRGF